MIKVAVGWPMTEWEMGIFSTALEVPVELLVPQDKGEIGRVLEEAEFAIVGLVKREHLERARRLRVVHFVGAGVDHLPLDLFRERGVILTAGKGTNARAVAELALGLILAHHRRIVEHDAILKGGGWVHFVEDSLEEELEGKTLGILGYGHIGRELARMAKCMGMRVLAMKRDPSRGPRGDADFVGGPESLDYILAQSDVLVLALPLTPETEGILGEREISMMKRGALLVNVGRGKLVDEAALKKALDEGRLSGAALDVWWGYPPKEGSPSPLGLHRHPRVIAHSHKGGWTRQSREKSLRLAAENVNRYCRGEELLNVVDLERGY